MAANATIVAVPQPEQEERTKASNGQSERFERGVRRLRQSLNLPPLYRFVLWTRELLSIHCLED